MWGGRGGGVFRVMVYPGIIKIESTTITIALSKGDEFTIRLRKNPFCKSFVEWNEEL